MAPVPMKNRTVTGMHNPQSRACVWTPAPVRIVCALGPVPLLPCDPHSYPNDVSTGLFSPPKPMSPESLISTWAVDDAPLKQ